MVTQFCELYLQHQTAVSVSPETVGALGPCPLSGVIRRTYALWEFTVPDPKRTSIRGRAGHLCGNADQIAVAAVACGWHG